MDDLRSSSVLSVQQKPLMFACLIRLSRENRGIVLLRLGVFSLSVGQF